MKPRTGTTEPGGTALAIRSYGFTNTEQLPSSFRRRFISLLSARVFARAGAHDEAVALLEELSTILPGLGPAEITRDPLYSLPLANNTRYQALGKKLEAEIAANQKLFELQPGA